MTHLDVKFGLVDHLNPGFGYQLRIENAKTGEAILSTSIRPDSGTDLTLRDCAEVINMYIPKDS